MGQGLGLALKRRGYKVMLLNRSPRDVIPPLVLHQGSKAEATAEAELILIATPDHAITQVAAELAREHHVLVIGVLVALRKPRQGLRDFLRHRNRALAP